MKNLLCWPAAALFATALCATPALADTGKLVPTQSEVQFITKQMGVPVDGRSKSFEAQVTLDPKKPVIQANCDRKAFFG